MTHTSKTRVQVWYLMILSFLIAIVGGCLAANIR